MNFLPSSCTTAEGRELECLSFLGPFFSYSVFAEDNVSPLLNSIMHEPGVLYLCAFWFQTKVVEKFFKDTSINADNAKIVNKHLQRSLEETRVIDSWRCLNDVTSSRANSLLCCMHYFSTVTRGKPLWTSFPPFWNGIKSGPSCRWDFLLSFHYAWKRRAQKENINFVWIKVYYLL